MKTNFVALGSFGRNMMNYYQKNCGSESGEIICLSNDENEIQTACLPKDSLALLVFSASERVLLKSIIEKLKEENNFVVSIFTMPFIFEKSENRAIAEVNKSIALTADVNIIFDNQLMLNGMLPFPGMLEEQFSTMGRIMNTIEEVSVDNPLSKDNLAEIIKDKINSQISGNFEII